MDNELFTLHTPHFTIEGRSRAGHETWFRVRELGIGLDIGRGPDALISMRHIFVTHAHLDHALGIPFYAGQRHLQRLEGGTVYVPHETAADFLALMEIHKRLERTDYGMKIVGVREGEEVRIGRNHIARAHRATHRVPANAWEILEKRHHLRKEFEDLDGAELAALRQRGTEVADSLLHPLLFYTGDTDRGILEQSEAIYRAEVLMIECSFIADGHEERAVMYRHIHFDDIAEFADRFQNEYIVLTHFSRRYSCEDIVRELRHRCPAVLRDRVRLALPDPWQKI
ncbi:MAG: MBL fold metallo-hydrolase [Thermoanaerobaculia bacterium]